MQRIILWTTLVALAALVVLSVVGAFQGPEKAADLFNSPPLVVYWFLLAGLLLSGLVSFKRIFHSPGPLAGHLGALLILIGAMVGSARWNAISHHAFGSRKVREGTMIVYEGHASGRVMTKPTHGEANLPFQLKLEKFWIDYYPLPHWDLGVGFDRPAHGSKAAAQQEALIDWTVGKETSLPFTEGTIKVLQYFPHAQPVYDSNFQPVLDILRADGNELLLPAKAGAEATLVEANTTLRIVRVLSHLSVVENHQVVDDPNSPGPPALELRIDRPGDANVRTFVWEEGVIGHDPNVPSLNMRYVPHQLLAARQASEGPPAMEVLVSLGESVKVYWFVPSEGQQAVVSPLELPEDGLSGEHAHAYLYFEAPTPEVKAYKSEIAVLKNGRQEANQTIEVNAPLHYGGYHFYQQDYDHKGEQYTVLGVHSDTGLYVVYAGFVLMTLGAFWVLWARRGEKDPVAPEQAVYRVVGLGFPVLTLGLVLGAWWGKLAWGDYWGWDPKELWGLASWLVFLGYLHWRYVYGRTFPRANLGLAVAGLLAILGTLFMVNLGMHSYSGSGKGLHLKETPLGCLIMGAILAYAVAGASLAFRNRRIGMGAFATGFLLATAAVVTRWIEVEHLPLQNMFEVFLFLGMLALPISVICRLYLHVGGEALDAVLGLIVLVPAAFVFTAEPQRLPPALQTWLFAPHVAAYMVAYVILAKAGLLALGQLIRRPLAAREQP